VARALERFGELHEAFVESALNASNAPEGRPGGGETFGGRRWGPCYGK